MRFQRPRVNMWFGLGSFHLSFNLKTSKGCFSNFITYAPYKYPWFPSKPPKPKTLNHTVALFSRGQFRWRTTRSRLTRPRLSCAPSFMTRKSGLTTWYYLNHSLRLFVPSLFVMCVVYMGSHYFGSLWIFWFTEYLDSGFLEFDLP